MLNAEYAVRWDPAVSQLNTAESVVEIFTPGRRADDEDNYTITYLDVKQPADLPQGAVLIVRERKKKSKMESTVKYRSRTDFYGEREKLGHGFSGDLAKVESKYEVDVSFADSGNPVKAYSLSYTSEEMNALAFYAGAGRSAEKKMRRLTIKNFKNTDGMARKLKIEYWELGAGGKKLLEVSMPGLDDEQSRDFFQSEVLKPLLAQGICPIERSKSELGAKE